MSMAPAEHARADAGEVMLELTDIAAGYGRISVLQGISLKVRQGETVALLGANGAGKTTVMRVCGGLVKPSSGTVMLNGQALTGQAAHKIARRGVCLVPEGLAVFPSLTVDENLELFAPRGTPARIRHEVLELFPEIANRLKQTAGTLSGGERQMLALARAYVTAPQVVLLDEVSLGLAPQVVARLFAKLSELKSRGISLLFVEQYVDHALQVADHVYVMRQGTIVFDGPADQVRSEVLIDSYLATESAGDGGGLLAVETIPGDLPGPAG